MSNDRPGYVSPYRYGHRAVTANLTPDEYEKLRFIADCEGIAPSTLATRIMRWSLSERLAALVDIVGKR